MDAGRDKGCQGNGWNEVYDSRLLYRALRFSYLCYRLCIDYVFNFHVLVLHTVGEMTEELILSGADVVKVGIGPGSVCTTRKVNDTCIDIQ